MAVLGATFHTGEKAPDSGNYEFVRHLSTSSYCSPTAAERRIPLARGETFPPCRSCRTGVVWKLIRKV